MTRAALLAALLVAAAAAWPAFAASSARTAARRPGASQPGNPSSHGWIDRGGAPSLERARAQLAAVKRDPARRRYRHNWEKAIRALTRAARGKSAPAALFEAARARYALYRFSAIEADRDQALALAARAARAGSRDASAFAAAVRREAGDDPEAGRPRSRRVAASTGRPPSRAARPLAPRAPAPVAVARVDPAPIPPPAPAPSAAGEEESVDPILEKAVTDLTGAGAPGTGEKPSGPARIAEVESWTSPDYTRVAVFLSRHVGFERQELAAAGAHPRRLALDFQPALLDATVLTRPVGGAQVERVRAAQRDPETVRVVLDLAGNDAYDLFSLDDPPRLIVDIGTREARRAAQAAAQRAAAPANPEPATPGPATPPPAEPSPVESGEGTAEWAEHRPIRRVVVDAGHGGHDTGAIGPSGVREKDVTLAMARRLARRLQAAGFEVVLTRSDDRFLGLVERTAVANAAHGDLFISLHANAHPRRDRRGAETYVLNVTDDRYAARLAARENGLLSEASVDRQALRIRSDLDATASAADSRRLAQLVQREICSGVRQRVGDVRDLGVKNALFYVLLGARMPAVLVETAFISNRVEERRLASRSFQDELAGDVARAVLAFSGRDARVATAR